MLKNFFICGLILFSFSSCTTSRKVYSNGFSFANYDYVIIKKPDGANTTTAFYGLDLEFANLLSRFNIKILGDKEFAGVGNEIKKRTLESRMAIITNDDNNLLSISFDDALSGRTVASFIQKAKGNMYDISKRTEAFEEISSSITEAIENEKGLSIIDNNK